MPPDPEIIARLARIESLLERALFAAPATVTPREPLPQFLSVEQFAAETGRCAKWVYGKIRARRLAVRPTGKPYQIPVTEVSKWIRPKGATIGA